MNSNWSYSPETKIWVVTSVTLTFDLWPWPFAWTLPWSNVITPENFMMIRWWEHSQKGVTDGQTDRRTDGQTDGQTDRRTENTIHRAAWSQLKIRIALRKEEVHEDMVWKRFPHYCSTGNLWNAFTKGQLWQTLMFSLLSALTSCWTNRRVTGDLWSRDAIRLTPDIFL